MITYTVKVHDNGNQYWLLKGKLHREDGPAIEYASGTKFWLLKGKLHREDGPAVEHANGDKYYYLDGVKYTEEQFNAKMNPTKELTVAEISELLGYEVKVVK